MKRRAFQHQDCRTQTRRLTWLCCAFALAALLSLPGCAGFGSLGQNVTRNAASDVGPPRDNRKEALTKEFDENRDEAQFQAAASAWQRGDVEGCRKLIARVLERSPNNRRARMLLADVELFDGHADLATEELSKLIAADAKDAMAHHALAEVLDVSGRRQEALVHYEAAAQLEPTNEVYTLSLQTAKDTGGTPPQELPGAPSTGVQGIAAPVNPQNLQKPLARAVAALAAGNTQEAIDVATRGVAQTPADAQALYRVLGMAHYRRGEFQAAQAALSQALSLDNRDGLAYFLMGSTLEKLDQHEPAAGYFAQAAVLDARFAR
ncbi:MAG TPA: tetratricopeptide repeat protein [Pirellulales bacterium]